MATQASAVMQQTYTYPRYPYVPIDEQRSGRPQRRPVVVVGAGPIGLTAALDCAARGIDCLVIDDNDTVSNGSRALCYAQRTLEIWGRLGTAEPFLRRGVDWKVGKVFFDDRQVYRFDLQPEADHAMPAMVNLQQYYLEEGLVRACQAQPRIDLRWKHRLVGIEQQADHAVLAIETPDGIFKTEATWVIGCDGANSDLRGMVGASFTGQAFQDRFLIADVRMTADFPTERWFWFDPPFHRGQSALLHKQADGIWRIDFQLGWQADPEEEKKPERVMPRIQAMLGPQAQFELEWVSVYQFACRRIDRFRHGRVLFAGDAAHQVSPFGARGANTGVQDIDNLAWKLAAVLAGQAPEALLDSYHDERAYAADDNLRASTRSTDFITPKSRASLRLRNAVLALAETEPFARPLVNSGRLSTPTPYRESALNTPDESTFSGRLVPGAPCADAPVRVPAGAGAEPRDDWLLQHLGGGFTLLSFGPCPVETVEAGPVAARVLQVGRDIEDARGLLAQRYDGQPGTVYLIRPDQYVAARWRSFDAAKVRAALRRVLCLS